VKPLPDIKLEPVSCIPSEPTGRFLGVRHHEFKAHFPSGKVSDPFPVDIVYRKKLDAVAIVAFYWQNQHCYIYLRSCLRPALMERDNSDGPVGWELPAGLIDPGETPRQTAARECHEELGFEYDEEDFKSLGHYVHTSVGLTGERIHFFAVHVNPADQKEPTLDGSVMEEGAIIETVELMEAIQMFWKGGLPDAKTEIALMRFCFL
jgi:ADP-ribose pyrophosphatase